jgi:hypothetical protein
MFFMQNGAFAITSCRKKLRACRFPLLMFLMELCCHRLTLGKPAHSELFRLCRQCASRSENSVGVLAAR